MGFGVSPPAHHYPTHPLTPKCRKNVWDNFLLFLPISDTYPRMYGTREKEEGRLSLKEQLLFGYSIHSRFPKF